MGKKLQNYDWYPRYTKTLWQMYGNAPAVGLGEVADIKFGYLRAQGAIINL